MTEALKLEYLDLDKIDISISNVRKSNLEEGIDELANSIREIDVQQPIVVFRKGDRYELIIGQRRYLACKKLGLEKIPAIITAVENETNAIIKSFSENIHRLDLEYRDKMKVATELRNKFGSIDKVAEHIGVTPQTVRNWLGYVDVPEDMKKMVDEKRVSPTLALRIWRNIPNEKQAVEIAELIEETPRSEDKRIIIDVARENPNKSKHEIAKIAKEQLRKVTIHITQKVYEAIVLASRKYQSDKEDVVKEALEEWLKKRGFIE